MVLKKVKNQQEETVLDQTEPSMEEVVAIVVTHIDPDVEAFVVEEIQTIVVPIIVEPKRKNYLNNKDLLAQVMASKEKGAMTNQLALMLQMLCGRYAKKGNFSSYSYNEDMQGYAMLMLVKTWNSFNPEKSKNPFAFFTQCIKNSFIQYLNNERKQRDVKNEILIDHGLNPSLSYVLEYENEQFEKRQALFDENPITEQPDRYVPPEYETVEEPEKPDDVIES